MTRQPRLADKAAEHLTVHPGQWFTLAQITAAIGGRPDSGGVHAALATLVAQGKVRRDDTARPQRYTWNPAATSPAPPPSPPAASAAACGASAASASSGPGGAPVPTGAVARPNGEWYFTRDLAGGRDVDVLRDMRTRGLAVLLAGPPGCGKTSLVEAAFGDHLETICGDADTTVGDIVGDYTIATDGSYLFVPGPLIRAMRAGHVLFVDDATLIGPKVLAVLYPAMDGRRTVAIKAQGGQEVTATDGFWVIAGHNPGVHGAVLTDALASRFGVHINVSTDYPLAARQQVPADVLAVAQELARRAADGEPVWVPQMRELLTFRDMRAAYGADVAWANLLSACPDLDRDALAAAMRDKAARESSPLTLGATRPHRLRGMP